MAGTNPDGGEAVPASTRHGDVLAGRYVLADLLSDSGGGRFWRAHDQILSRDVAIHVIPNGDDRAEGLLEAARRSATVHDRRILRVLDAQRPAQGLCFVVNEWGAGTSLDIALAEGPLSPRRAAWIVSEAADTLAVAHAAGVAHGRLNPENVLVDHNGSVRLIGLAVDAALHGLPPGRTGSDIVDLGGLLYAGLTGRWAGVSFSSVKAAPCEHGQLLRARQVRAGIPKELDALCACVLNGRSSPSHHDLTTARGIADALRDHIGDPLAMAEAEAARTGSQPALPRVVELTPAPVEAPTPGPATPLGEVGIPEETVAGMPVFDEERDQVGWISAQSETVKPPPPFQDSAERPLFAPDPPDGEPVRRPRGPLSSAPPAVTIPPPPPTRPPARRARSTASKPWLNMALLVGVCIALIVAVVISGIAMKPDPKPDRDSPRSGPKQQEPVRRLAGLTATDFDPLGDPPEEHPETAALAVDGDPTTSWTTVTYVDNLGAAPPALKSGVGLVVDLGSKQGVRQVKVTFDGAPTAASVYVTARPPSGAPTGDPAGTKTDAGQEWRLSLDRAVSGRYVTVWLTSLPPAPGGYRGGVAEVEVKA